MALQQPIAPGFHIRVGTLENHADFAFGIMTAIDLVHNAGDVTRCQTLAIEFKKDVPPENDKMRG